MSSLLGFVQGPSLPPIFILTDYYTEVEEWRKPGTCSPGNKLLISHIFVSLPSSHPPSSLPGSLPLHLKLLQLLPLW